MGERGVLIQRLVLMLALAGAAIRLGLGSLIGLSVDESYAVVMSRRLALSYFDHPPLIYWISGLAARLIGSEAQWVVRLPFIAMFTGTTWQMYRVGAVLFGERVGLWAAVALNLTLFFTLNAASWVLPDGPLLFWSSSAVLCLARGLSGPQQTSGVSRGGSSTRPWLEFGFFSGLALLSKYHAAFLLVGAGLFLVTSREHRAWLKRPGPYIAVAIAAAVFLPAVIWNAGHGWASFRFQGGRAVAPFASENDTPLLGSVAGQAAWMLPWVWIPLLAVLVSTLRRGPRDSPRWLLACFGIGPIAVFTAVAALGRRGLPHWQAPGYFMLLPLLGASIEARLERGDRWVKRWLWGSCGGLMVVLLVVVAQVSTGWVGRAAPVLLKRGDPTVDLLDWKPVVAQLRRWGYPRRGLTVAGATWADAAKLGYALGPRTPVASVGEDPRGFEFVRSQESLVGHDVLLVAARRTGYVEPMVAFAPYFQRIIALDTIPIRRQGVEEIAVSVYLAQRLLRPVPPTTRVR